jgi:hypothetical protein
VVATHYLNILFMVFLARGGIQILTALPFFYKNDHASRAPRSSRSWRVAGGERNLAKVEVAGSKPVSRSKVRGVTLASRDGDDVRCKV